MDRSDPLKIKVLLKVGLATLVKNSLLSQKSNNGQISSYFWVFTG